MSPERPSQTNKRYHTTVAFFFQCFFQTAQNRGIPAFFYETKDAAQAFAQRMPSAAALMMPPA